VTPLWLLPEMRHAANNSSTPSPSFGVTNKRGKMLWRNPLSTTLCFLIFYIASLFLLIALLVFDFVSLLLRRGCEVL